MIKLGKQTLVIQIPGKVQTGYTGWFSMVFRGFRHLSYSDGVFGCLGTWFPRFLAEISRDPQPKNRFTGGLYQLARLKGRCDSVCRRVGSFGSCFVDLF